MTIKRPRNFWLILMLGSLTTLTPFAIDLYLPTFTEIARDLGTTPGRIAFSLSSYFIGMSFGQLFYGPLLDRFGRKKPLYFGLTLFILASLGCLNSGSLEFLIAFRFFQAAGGCVASVAATAMVRDFFPPQESAKVFSLLMLILSVSPLFAPTVGGVIATHLGWPWVFIFLALIAALLLLMIYFILPEAHLPDPTISLRPLPILKTFMEIFRERHFHTYGLAGAFAFSGLFAYLPASPVIFMDVFKVGAKGYGAIFAGLSVGVIGASQLNILLMKRYTSAQIFQAALIAQTLIGAIFILCAGLGLLTLPVTLIILFFFLASAGLTMPNASALALAPFSKNAGSASALIGFMQIGTGAISSGFIGLLASNELLPMVTVISSTSFVGLIILALGQARSKPRLNSPSANQS